MTGRKREEHSAGNPGAKGQKNRRAGHRAALAAAAGVVVTLLTACGKGQEWEAEKEDMTAAGDTLYHIDDLKEIDLAAKNHKPGKKRGGMSWDETLFYWLEDVDNASDSDGNIADCRITKTLMRNAANGGLIEYETYRDTDTGEIYKIVGIEQQGSLLLLTDYYYMDGEPNFVFLRSDNIYTPTYATTDKTGKRFYFDQDTLVRYREIDAPRQIRETTLNSKDVSYEQTDYFEETEEGKRKYDEIELSMLNEAYNVYEAMQTTGIGTLQGRVTDSAGNPVAEKTVEISRREDGILLYRGRTDADGAFTIYAYLDGTACTMDVRGGDAYRDVHVEEILLSDNRDVYHYNLVMCEAEERTSSVQLALYDVSQDRGIAGAKLSFREGVSAYEGDVVLETRTDEEGKVTVELPVGNYTVLAECPGYIAADMEVDVTKQETVEQGWMIPVLEDGQIAVSLTWEDGNTDLDLVVYTPYQDTFGDMAHIYKEIPQDEHGNRLRADRERNVETAYLDASAAPGSYKIYVADYRNVESGDYASDAMAKSGACIRIYKGSELCGQYEVPSGTEGAVWEAAQVMPSGTVTPYQRVYREAGVLRLYDVGGMQ